MQILILRGDSAKMFRKHSVIVFWSLLICIQLSPRQRQVSFFKKNKKLCTHWDLMAANFLDFFFLHSVLTPHLWRFYRLVYPDCLTASKNLFWQLQTEPMYFPNENIKSKCQDMILWNLPSIHLKPNVCCSRGIIIHMQHTINIKCPSLSLEYSINAKISSSSMRRVIFRIQHYNNGQQQLV